MPLSIELNAIRGWLEERTLHQQGTLDNVILEMDLGHKKKIIVSGHLKILN